MLKKYEGIMFDMDNTLLSSTIDFNQMKLACLRILKRENVQGLEKVSDDMTASQLIELAKTSTSSQSHSIVSEMLDTVTAFEKEGMEGASLERGADDVLRQLAKTKTLVVVTNNATAAATYALQKRKIAHYFDDIVGRDDMEALKPSPASVKLVLGRNSHIQRESWVMIGDSWIDGKAAQRGNVDFIGYQKREDYYETHGIKPVYIIDSLTQLIA